MKSRCRDPRALDYGGYMLVDVQANYVVFGATPSALNANVDDIENYLSQPG